MGSKTLLFLCISLAIILMITSEVAARELAETSTSVYNSKPFETNGVEEAKYPGGGYGGFPGGGYGGYPGGGYGGYPGGGYGGYPGGGYGGYPGGGYGGYPGGGYGGNPGGGYGGGGGGYCRFGCCGQSFYGRGCRCCSYPGQAVDAEPRN
ncbi:hypothetical protein ACH5RR_031915 [Cinchona calisaya]|uniref:Glycine-rich protein n=1 Tax=Cinchona calisaya TaxID=153742 RepID=A0ABD2YGK9_9GENT